MMMNPWIVAGLVDLGPADDDAGHVNTLHSLYAITNGWEYMYSPACIPPLTQSVLEPPSPPCCKIPAFLLPAPLQFPPMHPEKR